MLKAINTKILLSGATVLAAAGLIIGATFAFFSDTETSTGNTFTAGAIDLQIDNESYVTNSNGVLVASSDTSWTLRDLTVEKFFNFTDIKPGDIGEDTISIHVGSNDAWLCAAAQITQDTDETCTEPESESTDPECSAPTPTPGAGELDTDVNFAFWIDDGDNVFETDEVQGDENVFLDGPISGLGQAGQIALADTSVGAVLGSEPVPGDVTFYIGKAWCFGELTEAPIAQDDLGKTADPNTNGPLIRGTGFDCDGSAVGNESQTDKVVGDLEFFAIQSRNNGTFTCAQNYTPSWGD